MELGVRKVDQCSSGHYVRVSPNDIVTDDLDHILAMSSVRSPYGRSEIYSNVKFDYEMDHVFSERNEKRHLELRRKLASGVSGTLAGYITDVQYLHTLYNSTRARRMHISKPVSTDKSTSWCN
jgi:regulator of protease activity HflC (stomatin/prohibitin superfamily)